MLIKTEKGRQELRPGNRTLGQRERTLLLLADGRQSESKMAELMQGDGRRLLDQLLAQGYLERRHPAGTAALTPGVPGPVGQRLVAHGEPFSGARSLASARMFLFDISERLFAPRDKVLASHHRHALREARDPQAMLAAGRALIADVERLAGSKRADGISERFAKLLPDHLLDNVQ